MNPHSVKFFSAQGMGIISDLDNFLNETAYIEQGIIIIQTNIAEIQNLRSRIARATSTRDEVTLVQEHNEVIGNIRKLFSEIKDRIKGIEAENSKIEPESNSNYELRVQRFKYILEKFKNVLDEYHEAEYDYVDQISKRIVRQYKFIKPSATQQEIQEYMENPNSQPVFQQAHIRFSEAYETLGHARKRNEDIKHIEQTIAELTGLFKDLDIKASIQNKVVVQVEENPEHIAKISEEAVVNLERSQAHALSTRKKRRKVLVVVAYTIIVIFISIAIILAIIIPKVCKKIRK